MVACRRRWRGILNNKFLVNSGIIPCHDSNGRCWNYFCLLGLKSCLMYFLLKQGKTFMLFSLVNYFLIIVIYLDKQQPSTLPKQFAKLQNPPALIHPQILTEKCSPWLILWVYFSSYRICTDFAIVVRLEWFFVRKYDISNKLSWFRYSLKYFTILGLLLSLKNILLAAHRFFIYDAFSHRSGGSGKLDLLFLV